MLLHAAGITGGLGGPIGVVADRLFEVVSHLGLTDGSTMLPIWRAARLGAEVTERLSESGERIPGRELEPMQTQYQLELRWS